MATDKQKKYTEELYGKITPYLMGPQANQETIDKAHSIYDIEAEKQQERNREKGLGRIAPVTAPTSEVKTGAAWLSDYVNSLKKPIAPEEEARRERAARAVQGVAGLGNVMTAFSNLAFTGKGAHSQTLPTQQADAMGKGITSWQDKLAAEREKYAAAALGAKTQQWKMEMDAKQRAQQQANEDRRFEYQKKKDEQTRQDKLAENAQAQENWTKQNEQSLKQQDIANKQNQQRLSISQQQADTAEKRAAAYANYQNWRVNGGGSSQNWAKPIEIKDAEGNNRVAYINQKAINDSNLQQIVSTLPEELREKHGLKGDWSDETVLGAFDEKVSRAIGEAAKDMNSETFRLMERLGLIAVGDSVPSLQNRVGVNTRDGVKTGGLGWGNGNIDLSSSW